MQTLFTRFPSFKAVAFIFCAVNALFLLSSLQGCSLSSVAMIFLNEEEQKPSLMDVVDLSIYAKKKITGLNSKPDTPAADGDDVPVNELPRIDSGPAPCVSSSISFPLPQEANDDTFIAKLSAENGETTTNHVIWTKIEPEVNPGVTGPGDNGTVTTQTIVPDSMASQCKRSPAPHMHAFRASDIEGAIVNSP